MKKNKKAGFWIRMTSRLIDLSFFALLSISLAFLLLKRENGRLRFANAWEFYLWDLVSIFFLFAFFILFPLFTSGQTLGMKILRIQIVFEKKDKKFISLLKRELFFSIAWIFNLVILLVFINHSLINKIAREQGEVKYSTLESFRIAFFTAFGSIFVLIQWVFTFSIMIHKDKIGIHDKMSKSRVVYKNKFELAKRKEKTTSFKPFAIDNKMVEWIENV